MIFRKKSHIPIWMLVLFMVTIFLRDIFSIFISEPVFLVMPIKIFVLIYLLALVKKLGNLSRISSLYIIITLIIYEFYSIVITTLYMDMTLMQSILYVTRGEMIFFVAVLFSLIIDSPSDLYRIAVILLIPLTFEILLGLSELVYGNHEIVDYLLPFLNEEESYEEFFKQSQRNIISEYFGGSASNVHLYGTLKRANTYANFLIFAPILLFVMIDESKSRKWRIYWRTLFFISIIVLYFSFSRGSLGSVLIMFLFFYYRNKLNLRNKVLMVLAIVFLWFLSEFIFANQIARYYDRTQQLTSRIFLWEYYWNEITGFNSINLLFGSHQLRGFIEETGYAAHNFVLILLFDRGIVGLFLYILFIFMVIRAKDQSKNLILKALKYSFIAFVLSQIFDNKIGDEFHRMYFFTYGSIVLAYSSVSKHFRLEQ